MLSDSMRVFVVGSVRVEMKAPEKSGEISATEDYNACFSLLRAKAPRCFTASAVGLKLPRPKA
jgi:hypothetical protein